MTYTHQNFGPILARCGAIGAGSAGRQFAGGTPSDVKKFRLSLQKRNERKSWAGRDSNPHGLAVGGF